MKRKEKIRLVVLLPPPCIPCPPKNKNDGLLDYGGKARMHIDSDGESRCETRTLGYIATDC